MRTACLPFLCRFFPLSVLFCFYTIYSNLFITISRAFLWLSGSQKKKQTSHTESRSRRVVITLAVLHAGWLAGEGTLMYNCLWRCSCRTRIVRASEPITSANLPRQSFLISFLSFYLSDRGLNCVRVANGSPMLAVVVVNFINFRCQLEPILGPSDVEAARIDA